MKAAVISRFGPPEVLQTRELPNPSPGAGEILVRVRATSVNFGDTLVRDLRAVTPGKFHMPLLFWFFSKLYFGFSKPKVPVLGSEFAGDIEAVGAGVTGFRAGDKVFGYTGPRMGAYAEYLVMPASGVVAAKPENMTYEEAAAVPYGAVMAWNVLKGLGLGPGRRVLVNGASGGIGPALVQLARNHFGAQVSGVCGPGKADYVAGLGAEKVMDHTKEDFSAGGESYDLIFDILGKADFAVCRRALKTGGHCFYISFKMRQVLQMFLSSLLGGKRAVCVLVGETAADLRAVKELIEAGKLRAVIDSVHPLEQASAAHRRAQDPQRKGGVVIRIG